MLCVAWLLTLLINCSPVKETPPGNDRFGLCFISGPYLVASEERYRGAIVTGARWNRWPLYWHWVDEVDYAGIHPAGELDYDTLVTQDLAHGLTPIAILMGTPGRHARIDSGATGANPSSQDSPTPKPNVLPVTANAAISPPASLAEPIFTDGTDIPGSGKAINPANTWAFFVFTTVDRYRPQGVLARQQGWSSKAGIRYWEVWNEPDFSSFWQGTVEEYYRLLEVAYKSIKAADPQATVILGGLSFNEQPTWFPGLLKQMEEQPDRAYFDVFSFHYYLSIYESERLIRQVRATLDAYGLSHIPIWITESGLSVWDDYPATAYGMPANRPQHGTMMEQAAYVIQNSALAFYNGVERYYHFMLHDDCGFPPGSAYGLRQNFTPHTCDPAEGRPRPAYAAYQLAATEFRDLTPLWREQQEEQDQLAFYRPDDRSRLVVLWARQGLTVTTTLTATGNSAQLYWLEPSELPAGPVGLSQTLTLTPTNGLYSLTLPPATNQNGLQPGDSSYQIGGLPLIVVERDTQPPITRLQPLPLTSPANFVVQWRGEDTGSGIVGYDVYVSKDDEPFQLWLDNTLQTEAEYAGQVDHSYRFAVRGRDRAGNEELLPAQAQVTTEVDSGFPVSGLVLSPSGEPVAGANVVITGPDFQASVVTNPAGRWLPVPLRPGAYSFQASAAGYGSWSVPRRINISDVASVTITTTLAPPTNAIAIGDFEGNQIWTVWQREGSVTLSDGAFDGQAAAQLGPGGGGEPTVCPDGQSGQMWVLGQQVSIPTDPSPVLSFLYKITAPQISANSAWLEVLLLIDGQPYYLVTPNELTPTSAWTLAYQDLSPWQGQAAELHFKVQRCSDQPFSVKLDRVSIGPKMVR